MWDVLLRVLLYFGIVILAAWAINRLRWIQRPLVTSSLLQSMLFYSGLVLSIIGFQLIGLAFSGRYFQPVGVVAGVPACLIGLVLGIIAKVSTDLSKPPASE